MASRAAVAASGAMSSIISPIMSTQVETETQIPTLGDTISVALGLVTGFEFESKITDKLPVSIPLKTLLSSAERRLITTAVKRLTINHRYKETNSDAALGFFRSSVHKDTSLVSGVVSGVKDYLSIQKGWFSPYLFASGRRPLIPRSMRPDIIFCHGPLLGGDYEIGQTLLRESATVIQLCDGPCPEDGSVVEGLLESRSQSMDSLGDSDHSPKDAKPLYKPLSKFPKYRMLRKYISRKDSGHPEHRLLVTLLGIKPPGKSTHWTSCLKREESCIEYFVLNGVPSIVIPAKTGCPLIAWDTLTLAAIYKIDKDIAVQGVADVLLEYLSLCIDWDKVTLPATESNNNGQNTGRDFSVAEAREALKDAITLLVAGVFMTKDTKAVREEIDLDRTGVVMFRIP